MKKKEVEQLKNKNLPELKKYLMEQRDKLWQLKVDLSSGKVKNVREIRLTLKNIAQILTFAKQKENGTKK